MKGTKKRMALLLVFAMLFSLLPGNAVAVVRAAEGDPSGDESKVVNTDPYFAEKDAEGNWYVYFLQYPKTEYKGEDVEVRLLKYQYGEDISTAEAANLAAFEGNEGKITCKSSGWNTYQLHANEDKTAYVISYDDFRDYVNYSGQKLSISIKEDTYYKYSSTDAPATWTKISSTDAGSQDFTLEWELPAELKASGSAEYDLTESYTATITAPEVEFKSDIDASKYYVDFEKGSFYGVQNSDKDKQTAVVNRNNSGTVSYSVNLYKKYKDVNGQDARYTIGALTFNYTDKTSYEYVKLGDTKVTELVLNEETNEVENKEVTYTYYLKYQKAIYNGDDLKLAYVRVKGTDIANADPKDILSVSTSRNSTLTLSEKGKDTPLAEDIYSSTRISADSFVEKITEEVEDEWGDVTTRIKERIYPEGEKTYTLTYSDGTQIYQYDSTAITLTDPVEIKLNWTLPGTLDVTEDVKEQVYLEDEPIFKPEFTPDAERDQVSSYDGKYVWEYRDSKDADWEEYDPNDYNDWGYYASYNKAMYPRKNGYYRATLTVSKNGNPIWEAAQEYHVSKVEVRPVSFIDPDGEPAQSVRAENINTSVGQNVTISPDVRLAKGYNVAYQWYKDDVLLSGKTELKLALSDFKEEDKGTYTLKATASLDTDTSKTPCYQATYTVYVSDDQPYTFDRSIGTWSVPGETITRDYGVGDTIDAVIPLVADSGYKATYQWYKRVYQAVSDYYDEDATTHIANNDPEDGKYKDWTWVASKSESYTKDENEYHKTIYILAKYEAIEGQTEAGLKNYKLTNDDFVKTVNYKDDDLDKVYTRVTSYSSSSDQFYDWDGKDFRCEVKVADTKEENVVTLDEYLNLNEYYTFTELYSPNQSEDTLQVEKGKDLTITAPDFEISNGYQVLYQWQQRVKAEDGNYAYDDNGDEVWENVGEASTSNTYKITEVKESNLYRVYITPARKDSTAAVPNRYSREVRYYRVYAGDNPVSIENLFRTTDENFSVKLGDKVTMGVEAIVAKSSGDCKLTYQWYHNGERLTDATAATYTIDKVDVLKFGEYECRVTATSTVDNENVATDSLTFTVNEESGITVTSPAASSSVVSGKRVGDKVTLQVKATAGESDTLTYSWYRRDIDTTSRTYGQTVKLEAVTGDQYELTLTENDFTTYTCRITNTRGLYEQREFEIVNDDLCNTVQAKNGVTVFDKKLGESVDLTVVAKAEDLGGTFTYQWYKDGLKIAGETKDTLSRKDLTEDQFGTYRCDWTYVKDNKELATGYIKFSVVQIKDESGDIFERVGEYGGADDVNGRNRIGDTVEFGVKPAAQNKNTYTYKWGFIAEAAYDEDVRSEILLTDKTTAALKLDKLTEDQFGVYHLYIYDADGEIVTAWDEDGDSISTWFVVRKYENNGTLTLDNEETEYIDAKTGETVTLSVQAESTTSEPITYQWYKSGQAIYGATEATYELKNLKEADFASYSCRVTSGDAFGVKRIVVRKTANLKLTHDILPKDDGYRYYYKKSIGESVTFEVNATADDEIVYQWYKGTERIQGATSKSYAIEEIGKDDYAEYSCKVTAGVDKEIVYFVLNSDDVFLSILDKNADGELEVRASYDGDPDYTIYRTAKAGDKVTLAPEVRASEGAEVSYQWYHYDKIQKRYIKIDGATSATYEATVTEEDLDDDDNDYSNIDPDEDDYDVYGDNADYRCRITTLFGEVNYYVDFFNVTWMEYKGMSMTATGVYPAPKGLYGYALEGATVSLKAAYTGDEKDLTYQWYEQDAAGNLRKVVGATDLEYSVKAPKVARVQLGDGKEQQDTDYSVYICAAMKDGEIVDGVGYGLVSIKVPDTLDELPKVSLVRNVLYEGVGYDVQGYRVAGADSLTFEFTGDRKLRPEGNISTKLVVFDGNGNFVEYPDADGNDIAGKTLKVNTDTAVFVYFTGLDDEYDEEKVIVDSLEGELYGYEVVLAKNSAVYDQEIAAAAQAEAARVAAEQAKVAADEAEKAALKQQLQEALDTAKEAKKLAEAAKATSTTTTTTTTTTTAKNPIKTVKAKKKTVTVKAGKTVTVTFNIAAKNKKAVTTDKAKTKLSGTASKGAKVTKTTLSKTTAKVKVKTNKSKKGTMKLKLTIGSKSATVKIKVK